MKKVWFKAKRFGMGWYPVTREGWIVVVAFAALASVGTILFEHYMRTTNNLQILISTVCFVVYLVALILLLIRVCSQHGDPLKWHWGD